MYVQVDYCTGQVCLFRFPEELAAQGFLGLIADAHPQDDRRYETVVWSDDEELKFREHGGRLWNSACLLEQIPKAPQQGWSSDCWLEGLADKSGGQPVN